MYEENQLEWYGYDMQDMYYNRKTLQKLQPEVITFHEQMIKIHTQYDDNVFRTNPK